jgi:S-adenosylmethionine synthetase
VNVWLCSQIGRPLADPWSVAVELLPKPETCAADLEPAVREVIDAELCSLPAFVDRLTRGELPIC